MIKQNKKAAPRGELGLGQGPGGLFISPLSNGALRAALASGPTRFGPSQMHAIGQAGHLTLGNQKRQLP
jgi:hypothetical protein